MDEIESQIAKIVLGNNKSSNAYVFAAAEAARPGGAELYIVAELPMLNPSAINDCERICLAIASALKRSYKKTTDGNSFENAIAAINDELGKLASLGQTQWIDRLNCILAVKTGHTLSIATCGKISAYLLRDGQYTDISCSTAQSHPLKTFENFATGKIKLNDLLILSTVQLFNYISMDRLRGILTKNNFLTATQTAIQLLKETAEPSVSFGVLLNLQVAAGNAADTEIDLEDYVVETAGPSKNFLTKGVNYIKEAFVLDKRGPRMPSVNLPKISLKQGLNNFGGKAKAVAGIGKSWWSASKGMAQSARATVNLQTWRQLNATKKFFFASIVVLALAVLFSLGVAWRLKNSRTARENITKQLQSTRDLLTNAQSALLYKEENKAMDFVKQAQEKLPQAENIDSSNKDLYNKTLSDLLSLQTQIEKVVEVKTENLGSLGQGQNLIKLPNILATASDKLIVSYDKASGKIQDNALSSNIPIASAVYFEPNFAAIYEAGNLYIWDYSLGQVSSGYSQSVPAAENFTGLAYYPTNQRVYLVDKKAASIVNFAVGKEGFARPVVALRENSLNEAVDMAIDGNIYVLTKTSLLKFASGRLVDFSMPKLSTAFSGSGKIATQKDFVFIYILDAGNNRILILDKKGGLVRTLKSNDFTQLKDFQVDEKAKIMYLLNDGSLLKVNLP